MTRRVDPLICTEGVAVSARRRWSNECVPNAARELGKGRLHDGLPALHGDKTAAVALKVTPPR